MESESKKIALHTILTHPNLAFKSRFRLGDQVAALTLLALIETQRETPARWFAPDGDAMTSLKNMIAPSLPDIGNLEDLVQDCGGEREGEHFWPVVDGNLWQWNWYFHDSGFKLDHRVYPPRTDVQTSDVQTSDVQTSDVQTSDVQTSIVFAPLMECGYSTERVFHPTFVESVIALLSPEALPESAIGRVVMPLDPSLNTRDVITVACERYGVPIIEEPLPKLIERMAQTTLWIGGDTGLSHVAGVFPDVVQLSLHDRGNTFRHSFHYIDHQRYSRMVVIELAAAIDIPAPYFGWDALTYRSFPNKGESLKTELFNYHAAPFNENLRPIRTVRGIIRGVTMRDNGI